MPLAYAGGHARRAPCLPHRGGGVRRQPPRHRPGRRAPDALDRLQRALTNDLGKIAPGRAQYTHLLDDDDASVLDDIIVWWVDDERFDVMPNASNTDACARGARRRGGRRRHRRAGGDRGARPGRPERLATVVARGGRGRSVPRRASSTGTASTCVVAGTGYTGEDGVELAVPAAQAPERVGGRARRRRRARRPRRPRHAAARGRPAAARPRARARASRRCRPASAGS